MRNALSMVLQSIILPCRLSPICYAPSSVTERACPINSTASGVSNSTSAKVALTFKFNWIEGNSY